MPFDRLQGGAGAQSLVNPYLGFFPRGYIPRESDYYKPTATPVNFAAAAR
ncbi:MAG: hypothetical protein NVSMB33_16580 [Ktedonobacteraceae bacterium]